ncbi:MAG: glycosyltransferase family 2 protein [Deltaproteobacteria bacterium]|nr:glycosyltransferase family 2 protein [Deltaproteobacteria bacterium]
MVKRLFESLARTATEPGRIEIILYLDADDTASHLLGHDALSVIRIIRPHGGDMGAIFKESYKASSGRYIMLMNDDAVFGTKGWDERIKAAFRVFPDDIAFVYGNDGDQGEKVPTFPMLSRAACEVMGEVCPAHYRNIHIESHLIDVFRQLKSLGHDRIVYLDDVIFEHMHYLVGKSPCDNIYAKKNTDADHQLFIELDEERRYMAKRLAGYIEAAGGARDGVSLEGCPAPEGQRQGQGCDALQGRRAIRAANRVPELSVIIPGCFDAPTGCFDAPTGFHGARGREEHFSRSLDAVISEAPKDGCEVVVPVSALAPPAFLRTLEANSLVKVIHCSGAGTLSGMFNAAAFAALGKYLVFIGPRIVPADGLIKALLGAARADVQAGVVGVKLLNPLNGRIRHAGIGFLTSGGRLEMSHLYRGAASGDLFANRARELQAVSGECMLVRTDAFLAAGGFNGTLGGLEDVDLCLKIKRLGMKVVYEPGARAYCHESPQDGGSMDMYVDTLLALWPELNGDLERLLEEDGFALRKDGRFFRCERIKSIGV